MKKNIGSLLALYPLPVTVIGAMNGANPTWTLVAHVGIIGHDKVLVSLAKPHFINSIIKETKKLTINLVQQDMLPEADLAGSLSGSKEDKSQLFAWLTQDGKSPIIEKSPRPWCAVWWTFMRRTVLRATFAPSTEPMWRKVV
ncbi:MAG: flavin reductase family protein [Enterocloster clostridioformis]